MCAVYDPRTGSLVVESSVGTKGQTTAFPTIYSMGEGITGQGPGNRTGNDHPQGQSKRNLPSWERRIGAKAPKYSYVCVPVPTRAGNLGTLACGLEYTKRNMIWKSWKGSWGLSRRLSPRLSSFISGKPSKTKSGWMKSAGFRSSWRINIPSNTWWVNPTPSETCPAFVEKIAPTQTTVSDLLGESGVGKELVANAIHYGSPSQRRHILSNSTVGLYRSLWPKASSSATKKESFTGAVNEPKRPF
jgi:Nif-specific regulatory protein